MNLPKTVPVLYALGAELVQTLFDIEWVTEDIWADGAEQEVLKFVNLSQVNNVNLRAKWHELGLSLRSFLHFFLKALNSHLLLLSKG